MRTINRLPSTRLSSILGLIGALALGGCASSSYPPDSYYDGSSYYGTSSPYSSYRNTEYGVVRSIDLVRYDSGIGMGTVAGAVVGGVVGNQIGAGKGKTAATVLGAAGGAYAGHKLENRDARRADEYKITVRMDDGSYQTVMASTNTNLRVGDRVRVHNGSLYRY